MSTAERVFMFELEERLHADDDGALRRRLIAELEALRLSLVARRRQLNPRETHQQIVAALGAVEAAAHALRHLRTKGGKTM